MLCRKKAVCILVIIGVVLFSTTFSLAEPLTEMTALVSKGLGVVRQTYQGKQGLIIVFEENHASRIGQVQIANMIARLYKQYGLRILALEGAFSSDGKIEAKWSKKYSEKGRLGVAAQLLGEGEISSAEFITIAFPDVQVTGIDDSTEYKVEISNESSSAALMYLLKIAEGSLSEKQIEQVNSLMDNDKISEAMELMINADSWTKDKHSKLTRTCPYLSIEKMIELLREIKQEVLSRKVSIEPELSSNMNKLMLFYEAANRRSEKLVKNTVPLVKNNLSKPVAMIIGAAHTDYVADLLKKGNYSFSVVIPESIADCKNVGEFDMSSYQRKINRQSVDNKGEIGSLLDNRKKPRPIINQRWIESKADLYYITTEIAKAFSSGDKPPFKSISNNLMGLENVIVDFKNMKIEGDEVIFKVQVKDNIGNPIELWVRVGYAENVEDGVNVLPTKKNIDDLLAEVGGDGGGGGNIGNNKITKYSDDDGPKIERVTI